MKQQRNKVADDPDVATAIRERREARQWSLRKAALELGWSTGRLVSYEAGRTSPTLDDVRHMSRVFGCALDDLLGRTATGNAGRNVRVAYGSDWLVLPASLIGGAVGPLEAYDVGQGRVVVVSAGDSRRGEGPLLVRIQGRLTQGWARLEGRRWRVQVDLAKRSVPLSSVEVIGRLVVVMEVAG